MQQRKNWIWKVNIKALFHNHMKQNNACLKSPTAHAQAHTRGNNNRQRFMWSKEIFRQQPPPSNSEELTCTLLIANYISKVGLFGIYSLNSFFLENSSLFKLDPWQKKKKKKKRIPISKNHCEFCLCQRYDCSLKISMFTITQKTW